MLCLVVLCCCVVWSLCVSLSWFASRFVHLCSHFACFCLSVYFAFLCRLCETSFCVFLWIFASFCGFTSLWQSVSLCSRFVQMCCDFCICCSSASLCSRQARSEIHLRTWRKIKATHFWSIWSYWLFISSIIQNRCDFKFWVQTECSWSLIWPDSSSVRDTFGFLADSRASRCSWVTAASTDTSSFSMCDLFHMHEQRVCCCCWRWNLNGSDPAGTPL